jgi:hypothetical protein
MAGSHHRRVRCRQFPRCPALASFFSFRERVAQRKRYRVLNTKALVLPPWAAIHRIFDFVFSQYKQVTLRSQTDAESSGAVSASFYGLSVCSHYIGYPSNY